MASLLFISRHSVRVSLRVIALGAAFFATPWAGELRAEGDQKPITVRELGGAACENWRGLEPGVEHAGMNVPGDVVYRVPDGPRGAHQRGLSEENDGTVDVRGWYALRFEIEPDRDDRPLTLRLKLSSPPQTGRQNLPEFTSAQAQVTGKGWHTITVPIESFDYPRGQVYFLKFVKEIALHAAYGGEEEPAGQVHLRNVRLVRAESLALDAPVRGGAADGAGRVDYSVAVTNGTDLPQRVVLSLQHTGWEGMPAEILPAEMTVPAGGSSHANLRVTVPAGLPPGVQETQKLFASCANGSGTRTSIEFITTRRVPSPYLVHDDAGWAEVRAKVSKYDWAKSAANDYIKKADAFEVPVVPPGGIPSDQGTPAIYPSYIEGRFSPVIVAWELTGERRYAEKLALLLRRLSDPQNGYPATRHAVSQGIPQEGGFFEGCAAAYDAIRDSGVLSEGDRRQIEQTLRLYAEWNVDRLGYGEISNWSLFNLGPAATCALAIQDLSLFDQIVNGSCGVVDHLRYGMMDDGWWYEVSLAYNIGCAQTVTMLGVAAQAFGIDLLHREIPAALTKNVGLRPFEYQAYLGMAFGKFGPSTRRSVGIKQLWDGITAYPDYRGVMFGTGDGHEQILSGTPFELAYYAFRDPAYAAVIKRGQKRDLIFGVPELPEETPELFKTTAKSDNAGIAVLRSQTAGRPISDQIQAAMKFGTHGSFHGHFDNVSLLSLMRDGRSFFNPETSWFGYGSYLYKWWVQTSMAHNMVVVDDKMQEPRECRVLLFHHGPMLQAIATETEARWSEPPYFGGYDQIAKVLSGDAPAVPVPADHPEVGALTGYTEPVRQRRMILVTDDYVILADALFAEREHTFDHLMQLRGASLPQQANLRDLGPLAQLDADPLGSGQFITGCERYEATSPVRVESVHRIAGTKPLHDSFEAAPTDKHWETGGAKSLSEPGDLHIDEYVLWPARPQIIIGRYAEAWQVNKKLTYEVRADDHPIASGTFGAWILGAGQIDADLTGAKTLRLTTQVAPSKDTLKTIFWGNAVVVTADGKEIPLSKLPCHAENVTPVPTPDVDYQGGPVRIAGVSCGNSLAAEPAATERPAVIVVDLTGIGAVRFKAIVGGDWPVGDEEQVRRTVAIRDHGTDARFLTLLEPYAEHRTVKSAVASGPDRLRVELSDGRVQEITLENFAGSGAGVSATIRETSRDGTTRQESAVER